MVCAANKDESKPVSGLLSKPLVSETCSRTHLPGVNMHAGTPASHVTFSCNLHLHSYSTTSLQPPPDKFQTPDTTQTHHLTHPCPLLRQPVRQLSNRCCLTCTIHPHNQQHCRLPLQLQLAAAAAVRCCCWLQQRHNLLLDCCPDVVRCFDLPCFEPLSQPVHYFEGCLGTKVSSLGGRCVGRDIETETGSPRGRQRQAETGRQHKAWADRGAHSTYRRVRSQTLKANS